MFRFQVLLFQFLTPDTWCLVSVFRFQTRLPTPRSHRGYNARIHGNGGQVLRFSLLTPDTKKYEQKNLSLGARILEKCKPRNEGCRYLMIKRFFFQSSIVNRQYSILSYPGDLVTPLFPFHNAAYDVWLFVHGRKELHNSLCGSFRDHKDEPNSIIEGSHHFPF